MLIIDKISKAFNISTIHKGDCVRVKYSTDPYYKNGFVTKVNEDKIQILYCNQQGNATSYLFIPATEMAAGLWEIYWTTDFITVNYESGGADA